MFYRETGQFKTNYPADQAIFPIFQDRMFVIGIILIAYLVVPFFASEYLLQAVLIPMLILSIAAVGLNILTGYAGLLSLGTAAFMAVGGYSAYKLTTAFPELNLFVVFLLAGLIAACFGILFGLPSLRIKGFYLAVATLAAQFFLIWMFNKVPWWYNYNSSGTITAPPRTTFGDTIVSGPEALAETRYLIALTFCVLAGLIAKNLVRSRVGRQWMAIRDMDVAAEIIGIRLLPNKLLAFAISSFYCGLAGALYVFTYLGSAETEAFDILLSFEVLFMVIIGGLGSILGAYLGAAFILLVPIALTNTPQLFGLIMPIDLQKHIEVMIFGSLIIIFLIFEPAGLARLWQIAKEKLRRWPFPY